MRLNGFSNIENLAACVHKKSGVDLRFFYTVVSYLAITVSIFKP